MNLLRLKMTLSSTTNSMNRWSSPSHSFLRLLLITLISVLSLSTSAIGGSATWRANPTNGDWNTPGELEHEHGAKRA